MQEGFSIDIEEATVGAMESEATHRSTSIGYSSGYSNAYNSIYFVILIVEIFGNAFIDKYC